MAKLATVGDLVTEARRLVQDVNGERYQDANYYQAINMGVLEAYRLRPDLFRQDDNTIIQPPQFDTTQSNSPAPLDAQYTPALVLYMVGMVQLEDDEGSEDARASALLNAFTNKLINHAA